MGEYMGDGFVDFFVMPQLVLGLCPDIVGVVVQHGRALRGFLRVFGSRGEIALIQLALSNGKNRGGSYGFRLLGSLGFCRTRFGMRPP